METQSYATHSWRSPKTWFVLLGILLVAAVVIVALVSARMIDHPPYQVSVIGRSELVYKPDVAQIRLGVQIDKAEDADAALSQLNSKIQNIHDAILKLGISADNIRTQNYSLTTQYDYIDNISTPAGYNANQMLVVTIDDIDSNQQMVTDVVAAATEAGTNSIQGISFEASNYEALKEQALLAAIEDARLKADVMADSLGVELDKVVGWWENMIYPNPYDMGMYYGAGGYGGGGSGSPIVPAGEQKLVVEVNVSYLIK